MKGIVLAGGAGTRLRPLTNVFCKQLLPVYNKPMVYYPISILMFLEIKEILLITTPEDLALFQKLLGDGSQWGVNISYATQKEPKGIAEAFIIGEEFIGDSNVALILGDNILYKDALAETLMHARNIVEKSEDAIIFSYQVADPERYGVIEIGRENTQGICDVISIEEKPQLPKSNLASIGLYLYPFDVVSKAKGLEPSARGELEIVDVNLAFLREKRLKAIAFGRGAAWLDAGTHESLLEASQFVHVLEKRQGNKIADLDEIAKSLKYIK